MKKYVFWLLVLVSPTAGAQNWANIGTVGTLNNNELCYTDGTDIICDAGLFVNGSAALEVSGTVSATAFVGDGSSLTGVAGLWTDSGDYVNYDDFRLYKNTTTIDVPNGFKGFIYDADKASIRVGRDPSGFFDDANIGAYSFSFGNDARATGDYSFAAGHYARATQDNNIAMGMASRASGISSIAIGSNGDVNSGPPTDSNTSSINTVAGGTYAVALGRAWAAGGSSFAVQPGAYALGNQSTAIGYRADALSANAVALGVRAKASADNALALGSFSNASGNYAVAVGQNTTVSGANSMVIGLDDVTGTTVSDANTLAILGGQVAVNQESANAELDVLGTVSATAFVGDGSNLTNVVATSVTIGLNDLTDGHSNATSQTIYIGSGTPTTGSKNVGIGHDVLGSNTTGIRNVAIGSAALDANTTGDNNIALGDQTLWSNQTGNHNFAAGYQALFQSSAVQDSVAIGYQALRNASGTGNIGLGNSVLYTSSGSGNIAFGGSALRSISTGSRNIGLGTTAGFFVSGGDNNIAMGHRASYGVSGNTTGSNNISIGSQSNEFLEGGSNNIAIGVGVDVADLTGSDQLNIGNTLYGDLANDRIGVGVESPLAELDVSGTVSATAFVGDGSGLTGVVATSVTIGLDDLTDAKYTVNNSIGIGINAQQGGGTDSVALGGSALRRNNGDGNTAVGYQAMRGPSSSYYSGSNSNVAVGRGAMYGMNNNSSNNIAIGSDALRGLGADSNNNIVIGESAGLTIDGGDDNILIGRNVDVSSSTDSFKLNIGNTLYGDLSNDRIGVGVESPLAELDVSGTVSATAFVGDGSS